MNVLHTRGLEISQPLSDEEMREWMQGNDVKAPIVHPWIEKATLRGTEGLCMAL